MWCEIFLALYFFYGVWMCNFIRKGLKGPLSYLEIPFDSLDERFKPITRSDRKNWRLWEIYFGAVFLFPWRFLGLILSIAWVTFIAQFLGFEYKNPNKE
jgi:hypothetical protein